MKIGIDVSNLHKFSKGRGIGYYSQYLIDSLRKYTDLELQVIEDPSDKPEVDIIHYPYFDFFRTTLPLNKKVPTVVTIHDVIPLIFPNHYPPGIKGRLKHLVQRYALKNIDAVITDSNSSKQDINKYLNMPINKIFTVYLSAAEHFRIIKDSKTLIKVKEKYKLPEQFVLYVGSVNWNKNLNNLVKASINAGVDLVMVGKDFANKENLNHPERKEFRRFIENFVDNPKIHVIGFVEDEDLVSIYNLASITLLVSFYEGFGLSILESQACGTPVITSHVSSMPEVAGKGALLIDPENVEEINKAIISIFEDNKLSKDLVNKGLRNSGKYSWKNVAIETSRVYKNLL